MSSYHRTIESLYQLQGNSNAVNNALETLGFSASESQDDDEEPSYPILQQFVERFGGFSSLHQSEMERETDFLNQGGNPQNFHDHFIVDPYLQTILNEGLEVKIGQIIYKVLDQYRTILITDGDLNKLEIVRNDPENYAPQENIFTHNALNPEHDDFLKLYDNAGNEKSLFCRARFYTYPVALNPNQYTFVSNSQFIFSQGANVTYTWDFGDGSSPYIATGYQGAHPPIHTFPAGGYPYTVTLSISGPACNSTFSQVIANPSSCFAELEAQRSFSHGRTFTFSANNVVGSGLQYTWDFGNGNVQTTSNPSITYTYPNNGTYNVVLSVSNGSCNYSTVPLTVKPSCGGFTNASKEGWLSFASNSKLRLKAVNYVQNYLWVHSVGAETVCYKKRNNGNWRRAKIDRVSLVINIDHLTKDNQCTPFTYYNLTKSSQDSKSVSRNYYPNSTFSSKIIRVEAQDMNSDHSATENLVPYGPGNLIFDSQGLSIIYL